MLLYRVTFDLFSGSYTQNQAQAFTHKTFYCWKKNSQASTCIAAARSIKELNLKAENYVSQGLSLILCIWAWAFSYLSLDSFKIIDPSSHK